MGGLLAKNFPWPSAIGKSQAVNPLVSSGPPSSTPPDVSAGVTPPVKPPLAPTNPRSNLMPSQKAFYGA